MAIIESSCPAKKLMNLHEELKKGVQYHQADKLEQASEIYSSILNVYPQHPEALHLMGLIAYQSGLCERAIELISKAIQVAPEYPAYYSNLANAYSQRGNFDKAMQCYNTALRLKPDYAEALYGQGNVYQAMNDTRSAKACYRRALDSRSDFFQACNNMGVALFAEGKLSEASYFFEKAIQIKPHYREAYINLGDTLKEQGQFKAASVCYFKAIELRPDCAEVSASLAFSLHRLGQLDRAIHYFKKALEIKPDFSEACNSLGTVYRESGQLAEAMACFQKSAVLKPHDPEAYNNMGIINKEWGQFEAAIANYRKALRLNPEFSEACYNLGNVYSKCGQSELAIECYQKATRLNPEHAYALNLLVRQLQQTCAWGELSELSGRLSLLSKIALENGRKAAEMPFLIFSLSDDPEENYRVAKSWAEEISVRTTAHLRSAGLYRAFSFDPGRRDAPRITIGYLSADFHNHATLHLMGSLFEYHNRENFKIVAYSYGENDHSLYRKKIERDCDKFVNLSGLNNLEAAQTIYNDQVDILVDLKGYTENNRLEICAYRPAPIQVSWLGFPGTTGADFLDYIITDEIVTPPEHASYFSEKFVYLPHTYQVNDCHQIIAHTNYSRRDFELPEDAFVFCSFNEPYKIEPVMFDVWMKILQQVPDSILWLVKKGEFVKDLLCKEAKCSGVATERLVFSDKMPKDKHLARYKLAGLGLDTRIVNGHTTTSDALWSGVPVITLQGNHFASRVSASLLTAVGLPELIVLSLDEYEALAIRLARNPEELISVKAKLARNRLTKPLFDTARFAGHLEKAYKEMWQIYLKGEMPRRIEVLSDE